MMYPSNNSLGLKRRSRAFSGARWRWALVSHSSTGRGPVVVARGALRLSPVDLHSLDAAFMELWHSSAGRPGIPVPRLHGCSGELRSPDGSYGIPFVWHITQVDRGLGPSADSAIRSRRPRSAVDHVLCLPEQ